MMEVQVTVIESKKVFIPEMPKESILEYLRDKWGDDLISFSFKAMVKCFSCGNRQLQEIQEEFICKECRCMKEVGL